MIRSEERKNKLGEVFTPPKLINKILNKLPKNLWGDPTKTWLDPTCGNGNFLVNVKARLLKNKHNEKHILENMIFGADIMSDNVEECILRLWDDGNIKELTGDDIPQEMQVPGIISVFMHRKPGQKWKLVRNLVCADGLVYDYSFGRPKDNPEGWDDIGLIF